MYIIDAGFGDRAFTRIELDLDELHLVAVDLEVDVVRAAAGRRRRRRRRGGRRRAAPPTNAREGRHVLDLLPVAPCPAVNTSVSASMLPFAGW